MVDGHLWVFWEHLCYSEVHHLSALERSSEYGGTFFFKKTEELTSSVKLYLIPKFWSKLMNWLLVKQCRVHLVPSSMILYVESKTRSSLMFISTMGFLGRLQTILFQPCWKRCRFDSNYANSSKMIQPPIVSAFLPNKSAFTVDKAKGSPSSIAFRTVPPPEKR